MSTSAQTTRTPRRRVRELEVEVVQARRDTPDTTTLFMSTGDEPIEYEAGHFCTIDPHQFGELEHFTAYLEDQKGQREKPRAYSMASAPHEQHLAITIKEERYESGETPYPPLLSPLLTYYIQEGRRLVISGFTGAYTFPADVYERTDHILHVCAGSGIVPNRSLIKESLHRGDPLRHTLLFSNKTRQRHHLLRGIRGAAGAVPRPARRDPLHHPRRPGRHPRRPQRAYLRGAFARSRTRSLQGDGL